METKFKLTVSGVILAAIGLATIPLLSIYSFFASIPTIIIGVGVIGLGLIKSRASKVAIVISSVLGIYYLAIIILMLQSPLN